MGMKGSSRKFLELKIKALREYVDTKFNANEKALDVALIATGERLKLLNELRGSVPTKEQFDALSDRFSDLKERLDKIEGSGRGKNALWSYVVGAAALAAAVTTVIVVILK